MESGVIAVVSIDKVLEGKQYNIGGCLPKLTYEALIYEIFCAKNGGISSGQLPPCSDALRQHTNRAYDQGAI